MFYLPSGIQLIVNVLCDKLLYNNGAVFFESLFGKISNFYIFHTKFTILYSNVFSVMNMMISVFLSCDGFDFILTMFFSPF